MMTNNQTATSNVKTTIEQPKQPKLIKGTKKNQAPMPCKPIYSS